MTPLSQHYGCALGYINVCRLLVINKCHFHLIMTDFPDLELEAERVL